MAELAGLEPVTSAVTGQRSNQLSYSSKKVIFRGFFYMSKSLINFLVVFVLDI